MREELEFCPLQPILFVIGSRAIYYVFLSNQNWHYWTNSWFLMALAVPVTTLIWKQLRITLLMLWQRPAVILTETSITITESGYSICWTDIEDIYEGGVGGSSSPRTYFIIIKVRMPKNTSKVSQIHLQDIIVGTPGICGISVHSRWIYF